MQNKTLLYWHYLAHSYPRIAESRGVWWEKETGKDYRDDLTLLSSITLLNHTLMTRIRTAWMLTPLASAARRSSSVAAAGKGEIWRSSVIYSSQEQQSGRAWWKRVTAPNFVLTTLCWVARGNLHSVLLCGRKVKDSTEDSLSWCHRPSLSPNSLQCFLIGEGRYPKGNVKKGGFEKSRGFFHARVLCWFFSRFGFSMSPTYTMQSST